MKIRDVKDIDTTTESGKLLVMAIAKITTESELNKTPCEVIEQLNVMRDDVYG